MPATTLRFVAVSLVLPLDPRPRFVPLHVCHVPLERALRYVAHVNERPHPFYASARLRLLPSDVLPE